MQHAHGHHLLLKSTDHPRVNGGIHRWHGSCDRGVNCLVECLVQCPTMGSTWMSSSKTICYCVARLLGLNHKANQVQPGEYTIDNKRVIASALAADKIARLEGASAMLIAAEVFHGVALMT